MNPLIGTGILLACALAGAVLDLRFRRLPNWLSMITAVAGLAIVAAETGVEAVPWALAHGMLALVIGAILFRLGMIGGGDAKFYAGCACWLPIQAGLSLLLSVSLAGLALVIVWFSIKGLRRQFDEGARGKFGEVPYGAAIAVGAVATRIMM